MLLTIIIYIELESHITEEFINSFIKEINEKNVCSSIKFIQNTLNNNHITIEQIYKDPNSYIDSFLDNTDNNKSTIKKYINLGYVIYYQEKIIYE
jgi:hypothetical protein